VLSNLLMLGSSNTSTSAWRASARWSPRWAGTRRSGPPTLRVVLPLGISFYTFQSLSYIIDVYRGDAKAMQNFVDFACFVSMFPHLVAGPILKFSFLADQLERRTLTLDKFARGVGFFSLGLAKKILLANPCGKIADVTFGAGSVHTADAWYGAVAYAFQIYFDFSGYSDMAIGLGLMLGLRVRPELRPPYRSASITEFWRRWHISLSTWLREYLYIPLGGNRKGKVRTYRQPDAHDAARGALARRLLELRDLGRPARRDARRRARPGRGRFEPAAPPRAAGRDLRGRAHRVGLFPGERSAGGAAVSGEHGRVRAPAGGSGPAGGSPLPALLPPVPGHGGRRRLALPRHLGVDAAADLAQGCRLFPVLLARARDPGDPGVQPFIYFIF
jgi:hypothetical protein